MNMKFYSVKGWVLRTFKTTIEPNSHVTWQFPKYTLFGRIESSGPANAVIKTKIPDGTEYTGELNLTSSKLHYSSYELSPQDILVDEIVVSNPSTTETVEVKIYITEYLVYTENEIL